MEEKKQDKAHEEMNKRADEIINMYERLKKRKENKENKYRDEER